MKLCVWGRTEWNGEVLVGDDVLAEPLAALEWKGSATEIWNGERFVVFRDGGTEVSEMSQRLVIE